MILVVDDQEPIRNAMTRLLEMSGFEVHAYGSASEALAFLLTRRPHCIILDVHMPGLSGLDLLAYLRADASFDEVQIIMCSNQDDEIAQQALHMGANAFVRKSSLDWLQFSEIVTRHCGPGQRRAAPTPVDALRLRDSG